MMEYGGASPWVSLRWSEGEGNHEGCPYVCAFCLLGIKGKGWVIAHHFKIMAIVMHTPSKSIPPITRIKVHNWQRFLAALGMTWDARSEGGCLISHTQQPVTHIGVHFFRPTTIRNVGTIRVSSRSGQRSTTSSDA